MVTHDVAATDSGKTDGVGVAFAGMAVALVDGAFTQIATHGFGHYFAHLERSARWGIDFVAVMRFDDFNVVAGGHGLGRHLQKLEGDVDADAHIGCHHDRRVFGRFSDMGFLCVAKPGGANYHLHAHGAAHIDMRDSAFGAGEIDQHLAVSQSFADVGLDRHATGLAQKSCRVITNAKAGGNI